MPGRLLAGGVRFRSWLADQWACNTHLQAVLFGFHNTSMAAAWAASFLAPRHPAVLALNMECCASLLV
jgi:hypothetical protein